MPRKIFSLSTGLFVLMAVVMGSAQSVSAQDESLRELIDKETREVSRDVITWRRHIHENPELSNEERKTAKYVESRLKKMGLKPQTGVAGTGVIALLKGKLPGPVVAVRADMDALPIEEETDAEFASKNPGVMHACGHDVHTSVLLGVARVLTNLRDQLPGSVKFIFQPAEEAPSGQMVGARLMVKENVLKEPDVQAIFGMHVASDLEVGTLGYVSGPFMASSDLFKITIHGERAHGAYPWRGVDAIVIASEVVSGLQKIASRQVDARKPVVVTVGKIQGGERFNIIAEEVYLEGTVRTLDPEVHENVPELMENIIKGITSAYGATYELDYERGAPVTVNDPELTAASAPSLVAAAGEENVKVQKPGMGAEDFAWFAREVPGFYFDLGVRNTPAGMTYGAHTSQFLPDEASLDLGVKAMAAVIIDYLLRNADRSDENRN